MIAQLTGTLVSKDPSGVVVKVGGVGYLVMVPVSTLTDLPATGSEVTLHTHQYVREDVLALYGFSNTSERRLFTQLLGVSGIGPKVALAILSLSTPDDIRAAIASGDSEFLASVPGIGKKTAERVVVDLQDKMEMVTSEGAPRGQDEAVEALVSLGYSNAEARKAVGKVAAAADSTEAVIKAALKELAR
ncbi:MAG: Holliday junction branch migration protein RuvA [Patescibacteria group bacterium]|nr:Holliday junction branch migration protein RuvA [Patescibacteria group bacterium]